MTPSFIRREADRRSPGRLLRASLLQLLYSIRSERQLMERLEFDDAVWDATVFTKNRDRVLS